MVQMHKKPFPIETEEAKTFWASRHKCNRMKAIIAFSTDLKNANDNLRRSGYGVHWRNRALNNFGMFVNKPSMASVPFTEMSTPWWVCMPYTPGTIPEKCTWVDTEVWVDTERWKECNS